MGLAGTLIMSSNGSSDAANFGKEYTAVISQCLQRIISYF
jgi:hypothetical protein